MRIISPFRDYYDGVQRQGYDPLINYVRRTTEVEFDKKKTVPFSEFTVRRTPVLTKSWTIPETSVVIVAGKPYLRVRVEYSENPKRTIAESRICRDGIVVLDEHLFEDFYNPEKLRARLEAQGWEPKALTAQEKWQQSVGRTDFTAAGILELFNEIQKPEYLTRAARLCREHRCPIIESQAGANWQAQGKLILNPCLDNIGFGHAMDPYTLYQEIAMYVSGVLGGTGNPMVPVGDKAMVVKKGFDPKYGFRKRPK